MDVPPDQEQPPSIHREASWGVLISIVVILAMIIVGAFYAWRNRVSEQQNLGASAGAATTGIVVTKSAPHRTVFVSTMASSTTPIK